MLTQPADPAAPTSDPTTPLTHGCVRCGAPVPLDVAMCDRCNPLGLRQPAASQAHGTIFLGIGVAVVGLAFLANLAVSGIGPFPASIVAVGTDPPGLNVTISVTNAGSKAGATTCSIHEPDGFGPGTAVIQTPRIEAGATVTLNEKVTTLGDQVRDLLVTCRDL